MMAARERRMTVVNPHRHKKHPAQLFADFLIAQVSSRGDPEQGAVRTSHEPSSDNQPRSPGHGGYWPGASP
jgi:hypothetical protein